MVVEVAKPLSDGDHASSNWKSENDAEGFQPYSPPPRDRFLVSFLVDARGGSMRGSRHPGLRVLVPPSAASAPTRITCRMLRPERTTRPPQLNDSEGLACRIIELGPHPCTFNTPVILEIPHFASLRGRQRELVVLRSDNAETWREHSLEATDQAVQSTLGQSFDQLETLEELREKRIIRILTNEFPQYLAVVSRMRQETALIGSDGGVLSSTVVPQVQAVFPEGALQKRIRVGLQAHPIPTEMVTRVLGNRVAASPIVTLEPRRRKFHKPITLTIPLPRSAMRGMLNPAGVGDLKAQTAPSLRLLCSITGGTLPAQWEDITGSTPLSKVKDCVSFTTTVSARFWLIDCQAVHESTELAGQLYREASLVPYMGKFVVFTKRLDTDEALIRCFCVTDDKVDKTLECQEGFEVCAASPEVEVVEGRPAWLEAAGNLLPVAKSDEQLRLHFNAFHENRLAFPVRLRDMQQEASGKLAFMREPRQLGGDAVNTEPQKPICTLEVHLGPEQGGIRAANSITVDPALASLTEQHQKSTGTSLHSIPCVFPIPGRKLVSEDADYQNGYEDGVNVLGPEGRWASVLTPAIRCPVVIAADVIARSQLDLLQVAAEIGSDWPRLVGVLIPESGLNATCTVGQLVEWIAQNDPRWQETRGGDASTGLGTISVSELRRERDVCLDRTVGLA
ncbi:Ankyrin-2 [Fasciola gigantica]|uniref:Ankyrin-2 n=1 Tax=Fasciola gigantica TaxID=46835 RepID=A0A504Y5A6_FASGI|nr:Ankyrin-2 [Fasciola gigantica]